MGNFTYRVKNDMGKVLEGEMKSDSADNLKVHLKEKGYQVLEVSEKSAFSNIENLDIFSKSVSIKELAMFCRQFAIILQAGVPIATALDVLRSQATNGTLRKILNDIFENMQKGVPLSNSMKHHKKVFPAILIHMVEAGEISGKLDEVFDRMAETYEKEAKLNQKVKGALTYPAIIVLVAVGVIAILMIKVVPSFVKILTNLKAEMPLITKILISVSAFFQSNWLILLGLIIGLFVGMKFVYGTDSGKATFHGIFLQIPIINNIIKKIITARFTRTLGVLLGSGVLLIQSMEVVQKVVGNMVIEKRLEEVIEEIKKGKGLYGPMNNLNYFPPMLISMVKIGEETGELDFSLIKCSDYYDQEVEAALHQATAMIEPAVMITMAIVVGFIVLSILYPMLNIYQTMSQ